MQPHLSYLICATPRSGSTLLCEALTNTGIAGQPEEYFQTLKETGLPRKPLEYFEGIDVTEIVGILGNRSWENEMFRQPGHGESYAEYLAKVLKRGTSPNGVFGAKVMWDYFDSLTSNLRQMPQYKGMALPDLLSTVFPNLCCIWVTRRDKVRQAVSLWKAIQTWTWRMEQASYPPDGSLQKRRELVFHFDAIDHLVQWIIDHEISWQRYFNLYRIQPFIVVYEEFVGAYEPTVLEILQYLNIPIPENLVLEEPHMKKQADTLSEEWVQRYQLLKGEQQALQR